MGIRKDSSHNVKLISVEKFNTRAEIRAFILKTWGKENIHTRYRYFVEKLSNKKRIYLERPGRLNKGCDFVIFIEDEFLYKNKNDRPPRHDDILQDLKLKKQNLNSLEWDNLLMAIKIIFDCKRYKDTIQYTKTLKNIGLSYEALLKLVRWFFIEQDLTYWSGKGREMFYDIVENI